MKKILLLLFCVVFAFSGCSSTNKPLDDSDIQNYIGEGTKTAINILIDSNAFLVENVFVNNHLPVDSSASIKNENGSFAPVVSEEIKTYADLESMVKATYTAETAQKLLDEKKYVEIDGKLYFDMKFDAETEGGNDWSDYKTEISNGENESYAIAITVRNAKHKKIVINAVASNNNGSLRLENIYS